MESALARICREGGGRVATNRMIRDLDLAVPIAGDARRIEFIVDDLALEVLNCMSELMVCPAKASVARDGVPLTTARQRKQRTYPELSGHWHWCRLVCLGHRSRRWSLETRDFLRALARDRAQSEPPSCAREWNRYGGCGAGPSCRAQLLELWLRLWWTSVAVSGLIVTFLRRVSGGRAGSRGFGALNTNECFSSLLVSFCLKKQFQFCDNMEHPRERGFKTLQCRPARLEGRFRQAAQLPLEARLLAVSREDVTRESQSWKLFCLLPYWLLRRPQSKGRVGKAELSKIVRPIRERTMGIVARGSRTGCSRVSSVPPRHVARAEGQSLCAACSGRRSVHCPAVPGAAQAPGNDATFQEMQRRRPQALGRPLPEEVLVL